MRNITNTSGAFSESLLRNKLPGIKRLLGVMLCVGAISLTVLAAPADLDPTFGVGGKVVSNPTASPDLYGSAMAIQTDGKIIMVGGNFNTNANVGVVVARYNTNGSLDTTFGTGGFITAFFGYSAESGTAVAIQPDGKIVVGGNLYNGRFDIGIMRLNPNGSLDTSFDGNGSLTIDTTPPQGASRDDEIASIKIASDGKIVFAGAVSSVQLTFSSIFGRLNADGSRDQTFGTNGILVSGGGKWDELILNPDGTMFAVGGASTQFNSFAWAIKYDNNGAKLWTYSRSDNLGNIDLHGIAVQPDGKLVVVGLYLGKVFVIRLNTDGSVDNTFVPPATQPSGEASSVAIQADGKIVASFSANPGGFRVVRYNADGSLDLSFGNGGIVVTFISGNAFIRSLLIQADGKILVGGWATNGVNYSIAMARYLGGSAAPVVPLFDYDGDGKDDISVFRPLENKWYILRSSDGQVTQQIFAIAGDVPVPSDYDGDGKTDMAIYRPSSADWWSLSTVNGNQNYANWGQANVIPRPSDFDGDGKSDYIFFLPSNSTWYRYGSTVGASFVTFGLTGDKPVTGDFDGDGKSDVAIYRPSTGDWWWKSSISGAQLATHWGISTDIPSPADYDGDGKTDFAVYRPSTGTWYVYNSAANSSTILNFGLAEDKPVPADYDGDGKADIAVFRPSTGIWYFMRSTQGFAAVQFGVSTDLPTPNAFVP